MGCSHRWVPRLIWILTFLLVGYIGWASTSDPEGLWAPGDLSRFHTDIEECLACHTPFRGANPSKCIVCHSVRQFLAKSEPDVSQEHQEIIRELKPCSTCHIEHQGVLAGITLGWFRNPHGEFIFRATGTSSCSDCHLGKTEGGKPGPSLLNSSRVRHLIREGEGAHRIGRFANCLKCHRGGRLEVEDEDDKEGH